MIKVSVCTDLFFLSSFSDDFAVFYIICLLRYKRVSCLFCFLSKFSHKPLHNSVSTVKQLQSSVTVYVHKHYVYICKIRFGSVLFQPLLKQFHFLCITFVAEDNCKLVAQNVTLKLKINIVLLDCMKWEDVSGSFSKM